jgi:hypothetical protein
VSDFAGTVRKALVTMMAAAGPLLLAAAAQADPSFPQPGNFGPRLAVPACQLWTS